MSLLGDFRKIISGKARELQNRTGTPNTKVDSAGSTTTYSFDGQSLSRGDLRDVKDIRESGGVISQLVHAKALMQFGTGITFESDEEEVSEWLRDELNDIDNLLIDLGEDAIWYPWSLAEIVETQGGGFSHIEPVEPWTMMPIENEYGEILAWEQEIRRGTTRETETFEPEDIASFILNKSSARDKTGISEVMRAEEEVMQFRNNRQAVNSAIEIAGFPHHVWKVGREGASVIDDNELRRIRNMVDSMEGDTQFVMGRDIEHEMIKPGDFDFSAIQEHDLRELALAIGLPLELANVGSDGLGSGMPAELRLTLFERQARAAQRSLADQFVQQIVRPILDEYSPYPRDVNVEIRFGDPVDEEERDFTDMTPYLTTNEIREELDRPPVEDGEIGESFRKPANIQAPEEEEPEDDGGFGGFFEDDASQSTALSDGGTGNGINLDDYPDWERNLLEFHTSAFELDKDSRVLSFTESELPEFVKQRLTDAIRGGAIFSHFENVPSSELMQLRQYMEEELTQSGGWTIDGLANRLQDLDGELSFDQAETIARTETASVANTAREIGYEEQGLVDESKFYWTGSLDDRTTDACRWLIEKTNPFHGGDPVSLERLEELIEEAPEHDDDMPDNMARPEDKVVHINERKTWARHVE